MGRVKSSLKSELFGVMVTPQFKAAIERAARDGDQTPSDYARRLLRARLIKDGYLKPKPKGRR